MTPAKMTKASKNLWNLRKLAHHRAKNERESGNDPKMLRVFLYSVHNVGKEIFNSVHAQISTVMTSPVVYALSSLANRRSKAAAE
jgi:hypothetical protein